MTTHELLREGEWTRDGRLITPDSVTWPVQGIPLFVEGIGPGREPGHLVSSVTNLRREGNRIVGDTEVEIGDMVLTCDCDYTDAVETAPGHIEMTGVRILAAVVNDKETYPWNIEEEGGGANAR